jgi:hypothetical protein
MLYTGYFLCTFYRWIILGSILGAYVWGLFWVVILASFLGVIIHYFGDNKCNKACREARLLAAQPLKRENWTGIHWFLNVSFSM